MRKLFVQGARAVLQFKEKQPSGLRNWLAEHSSRTHHNVVGVALANKLVRTAGTVLAKGEVLLKATIQAIARFGLISDGIYLFIFHKPHA